MDKILTISIAAYNVEGFIEKNLKSIVRSKCVNKVEVIVVNDGSMDRTDGIVKKYIAKYPESIRLISKKNGGYGSTVNESIKIASGKYFRLLDGDDWVDSEELDEFIRCLEERDEDLVLSPFYKVNEQTGEKTKVSLKNLSINNIEDKNSYRIDQIIDKVNIFMHGFTFKTDIYKKNNQELTEKCFYTDNEFIFYHLNDVKTVYLTDCYVYCYRVGLNEQSISIKGYQRHYTDHIKVIDSLIDYYEQNKDNMVPQIKEVYQKRITELICIQYKIILYLKDKNIKQLHLFDQHLQQVSTYFYNRSGQRKFVKLIRFTKGMGMKALKLVIKFD